MLTESEILDLANAFRPLCPKYDSDIQDLDGLIEDTGGMGLCTFVAAAFIRYLEDLGLKGNVMGLCVDGHPAYPGAECIECEGEILGGHVVAMIDGFAVDHTARQFGDHLPYPYVWRMAC